MLLQPIDLTTALRPSLLLDETLLFVQDGVGLYEGKFKIPNLQNGHAYLTSHRACYVDNEDPRGHSFAIELKNVDRYELYAGFLKSSPKITFYPKHPKQIFPSNHSPSRSLTSSPKPGIDSPSRYASPTPPQPISSGTWICPICSFSNPVPSNFDPATANVNTPLPPCLACGIKPPLAHVLKAAISSATRSQASSTPISVQSANDSHRQQSTPDALRIDITDAATASSMTSKVSFACPRCTFLNHPSLLACEICGTPLLTSESNNGSSNILDNGRSESPGPLLSSANPNLDLVESVKFSFRVGGVQIFYERLKGAMVQRKWLLQGAPPVPKPKRVTAMSAENGDGFVSASGESDISSNGRSKLVGIAGLERLGLEMRKNNEIVIGGAFEDLEALMASAKELVALAESFATRMGTSGGSSEANALLSQSANALGLVTTRDMLGGSSDSLYLSELARNLAEFLTDDVRGVLRKEGGIISLVDLWAVFNRARGGVELVSPTDFKKAAELWEQLKLPVRLRTFKSGLLVVQGKDRTDEKTVASLLGWLKELHSIPPSGEVTWDWKLYGRGVTAQDCAERFGWSVGVSTEELEMAEEKGALCRDEGVEGVKFWENHLTDFSSMGPPRMNVYLEP